MAETMTSATIEISAELDAQLEALARDTNRSKTAMIEDALAGYIEWELREIATIRERLEEAEAGAPTVPHEEVVRWVNSWGSDNELPRPKPR